MNALIVFYTISIAINIFIAENLLFIHAAEKFALSHSLHIV